MALTVHGKLRQAVIRGNLDRVKTLLKEGADLRATDRRGFNPLMLAVEHNQIAIIKYLAYRRKAPAHVFNIEDNALDIASRKGYLEALEILLKYIKKEYNDGWYQAVMDNILIRSLHYRQTDKMLVDNLERASRLVIKHGANPNASHAIFSRYGLCGTFFAHVVAAHRFEFADFLLEHGADINGFFDEREKQPLIHHAVAHTDIDVVRFLIKHKINIEVRDSHQRTPLIEAVKHSRTISLIRLLLDNKANLEARDEHGDTPLMIAVSYPYMDDIITLLLDHGADINATNPRGETILGVAKRYENDAVVEKWLIQYSQKELDNMIKRQEAQEITTL